MTERVRITHPRTTAARPVQDRPPAREIDELTAVGELYLASLMRSQRRTAFAVCLGAVGLLLALALGAAEFPGWSRITLAGVRLPWVLVGAAVYPVLLAAGALAVRLAERNEREFAALMRER
ncbi:MAG: hypothetical protein ACXVX8_14545 [Blastococcus sp.]